MAILGVSGTGVITGIIGKVTQAPPLYVWVAFVLVVSVVWMALMVNQIRKGLKEQQQNAVQKAQEEEREKITNQSDKEIEDTIRGWIGNDPNHSIRKTETDGFLFNFIVTNPDGQGAISVGRTKVNPKQVQLTSIIDLSKEHKTKYSKLRVAEKNRIVNQLRIEMARYGISFQNLSVELQNVGIGASVSIDDSLTEYHLKNRLQFVYAGLVLYSEIITQGLMTVVG